MPRESRPAPIEVRKICGMADEPARSLYGDSGACRSIRTHTARCALRVRLHANAAGAPQPITVTVSLRFLGPSNSQKKIACQVPNISLPAETGTVSEEPTTAALAWAWALPSSCL